MALSGRSRGRVTAKEMIPVKLGLLARIEAKPEHAEEVATMLAGATQIAEQEG